MELIPLTLPQLFVIAGLLFAMAELFVGIEAGFDLVAIGSVLIISGFAGIATGSTTLMLALAAILVVIYISIGRTKIQQRLVVTTHSTNIDKLPGKTGITIRSITPDTAGMVRVGDEDWRATSNQLIHEKDKVTIKSVEGVTLIVTKA